MADSTITDLPDGGVARVGDLFPVDRDGQTQKVTLSHMGNLFILSPVNLTIPLVAASSYAFAINGLAGLKVASGSLTLSVEISGVPVTGLSDLSVTSTSQSPDASGLNAFAIDDEVAVVISNVSDAVGLQFTMF